jgi:hypothetical protein
MSDGVAFSMWCTGVVLYIVVHFLLQEALIDNMVR